MKPWAWLAMLAVVGVGCGGTTDDASNGTTPASASSAHAATSSAPLLSTGASSTPATSVTSASFDSTDPTAIDWMVPSVEPPGLRLIDARRELVPGCGPLADCPATVPSATLVYDTDDLSRGRSLRVVQTSRGVDDTDVAVVAGGVERNVGGRTVTAVEQGDASLPFIAATWSEPDGRVVDASSVGLDWDQLAAFIDSLRPTEPARWPVQVEPRLERCVDARTQYAPLSIPDGWSRFVLQAAPTGTCGVPTFLMMSLVVPGTAAGLGTLVTFVTGPASEWTPQSGEPIVINGNQGTLREDRASDGTATAAISFILDAVAIDAHGNVDAVVLHELVAGVGPVTDAEWAQLVSEVSTP